MVTRPLPSFDYRPSWLRTVSGRLAIAGADGFIGSHVAAAALAAGAEVVGLCSNDPWRLTPLEERGLELAELSAGLPEADAVAVLSYEPPRSGTDALEHELSVNTARSVVLAEEARRMGARVVFSSSADVYGPRHEEPVSEKAPPEPLTPYARAKLAAEEQLRELSDEPGACVSLRIATVFGPSEHAARAVPAFICALSSGEEAVVHGDGSDVRDYVYVGDVAGAVVATAFAEELAYAQVNVGSGYGRSTLDVLHAVANALGVEPRARFEPSPRAASRVVLDVSRAASTLGFDPYLDFETLLAEEIRWLRAQ